jgi:histidyl-tRNA synthetase
MAKKYTLPRGTYDIVPEDEYKWQYIIEKFRSVAKRFDYYGIATPIFEKVEVFERSVGDESDIVQKEMYTFVDRKNRKFALRPEGTAPVVRAYVENGMNVSRQVSKLFYYGPMFRYDRPQRGRYRQFYQFGIEYIGSDHPYADAEVIAFGSLFFKELGLQNVRLEINSIGCKDCGSEYDKALIEYFKPYYQQLCSDCKKRMEKNPKRLLDCKNPTCKNLAQSAPAMLDYLDEKCENHFLKVQEYLNQMDIPFEVNARIVRGLDYYNKTAFEFIYDKLGAQNAIAGGGRYDGLVKEFGGNDTPGIGFAGGFERLILTMEEQGCSFGKLSKIDIYCVSLGESANLEISGIIMQLRKAGFIVAYDPDKTSMKAQMKAADKSDASFALILGENELKNKSVILRELKSGQQSETNQNKLIEYLTEQI